MYIMADFCQLLTIFFMEFINIGPGYIRRWVGVEWGWGGGRGMEVRWVVVKS